MSTNRIVIMGRLTKDPELNKTSNGNAVCNCTVAVDRSFTENGQRQTDFVDVVAWRRTAEFLAKYFVKGRWILVDGRLQSRKWQDKHGQTRVTWEVMADEVSFCGDRKEPMAEDDEDEPPRRRASDFGGDDNDNRVPF